MRYRLQRHDGTDCSATMVPITVLRMVPIQRYRQHDNLSKHFMPRSDTVFQLFILLCSIVSLCFYSIDGAKL